jgi:hypothetical protein
LFQTITPLLTVAKTDQPYARRFTATGCPKFFDIFAGLGQFCNPVRLLAATDIAA